MQKLFFKFLILYSIVLTAVLIKTISAQPKVITLTKDRPVTEIITKEILKKEIVYKEPKIEEKTNFEQIEVGEQEELELLTPPENLESEQRQQEVNHDNNSEKMLAFFEQAVGIDLTPEQEQKALSALRAYDEADPTAIADADTAFLDRKLDLSAEQKTNVRKAITEFNYEPDTVSDEIADREVLQIESQNQAYFDQVAPFLDDKQKAELLNMMNQGTMFVDE